jgi:hypothetical protein
MDEDIWHNRDEGDDEEDAPKRDDPVRQASELERILVKNALGIVTQEERNRAYHLIVNGQPGEENCRLCEMSVPNNIDKAIAGTPYCRGHALYLLATQK